VERIEAKHYPSGSSGLAGGGVVRGGWADVEVFPRDKRWSTVFTSEGGGKEGRKEQGGKTTERE